MNRKDALKFYKLGRSLRQGSQESQYCFDLSIQSDNTFSYSYFEKSVPYNKRGDYSKGFALLNKAVELNPKMHLGYRGWLRLMKFKDYLGCIRDLEELQNISPKKMFAWGQNINCLLAISYYSIGKSQLASSKINIAIQQNSELATYYLYRAIIGLNLKNESVIDDLLKCIDINNQFAEAYFYLGKFYIKTGHRIEAIFSLKKALELIDKGEKMKNPYNEVFKEIYKSDCRTLLRQLSK
ncbi:Hypothetical protein I595_312 [Croceitalea dokdonensis DOKDO 023]|uniref:Tetratricopeptide repeat protein n=1 Tax=Croceitalea dokdonensis DOKDO 023 TaxID=1300341 RepID=A0A0P7AYU5_9FLAO|nr:hypothetical protein [Croceitalea dokdonensis]KPM33409.1 Hypothetical protein I595_312 [Croceitalea dokdonensis DOKDO 023]